MSRIFNCVDFVKWRPASLTILVRGLSLIAILMISQACTPAPNPTSLDTPQAQTPQLQEAATPTEARQSYLPAVQSGGGGNPPGAQSTLTSQGAPTEAAPDPHVEVQADHTSLKVGETVTITGAPVEISNPTYEVNVRDPGVEDIPSLAQVTYSNEITPLQGKSGVLEFVSAQGGLEGVTFVLRAKAPGTTTVTVIATGEIHNPGSGQASWTGQGEGTIDITVTN